MKAVVCEAFGPPDTLVIRDLPRPEPGAGQVRVKVHAAGVNFPDLLMVQGLYQLKPPFPFTPGSEVAGVIEAVGEGVEALSVGDRVVATLPWGGYAEEVVADAPAVFPIPDELGFDVASALVIAYGTTMHALIDRARLAPAETLLVLGAAGGVGLAAVQIGKALGAHVIAAASSPEKLEVCTAAGADAVIDYSKEDLKARAKALTGHDGADVIFDPVGAALAEPALRAIAWGGRYLVIGFAGGAIPEIPLNLPLLKGCAIVGVFWGSFAARDPKAHLAHIERLVGWCEDGTLGPRIDRRLPLAEASEALEALARRDVRGKLVLTV